MPVLWVYREDDNTFPSMEAAQVVENIKKSQNKDFAVVALVETGHATRMAPTGEAVLPLRMLNEAYMEIMDGWIRKKVTRKTAHDGRTRNGTPAREPAAAGYNFQSAPCSWAY